MTIQHMNLAAESLRLRQVTPGGDSTTWAPFMSRATLENILQLNYDLSEGDWNLRIETTEAESGGGDRSGGGSGRAKL